MIYLKKLELFGFKSFPERTDIFFSSGINVIVGPNGTGKSNILDGIVWGLGETKISTLRGIKTEDIIFNGNSKRRAMGSAEVSLVFSINDEDEVIVYRRAFRDGESVFRLNGKRVRLKDIEEKLYEIGIGGSEYFYISQGSIGSILEMSSIEKRILIEEAAGISRYREKKKEIYKKLIEAENNLTVVESLIEETKNEMGRWEKEAKKLKEYRKIKMLLRDTKRKLYSSMVKNYYDKLKNIEEKLKVLTTSSSILKNEVKEDEKAYDHYSKLLWEIEDKVSQKKEDFYNLTSNLSSVEDSLKRDNERLASIKDEINKNRIWIEESKKFITTLKEKQKKLIEEKKAIEEKTKQFFSEKENLKGKIEEAEKEINLKKEALKKVSEKFIEVLSEFSSKKSEVENLKTTLKSIDLNIKRKTDNIKQEKSNLKKTEDTLKEIENLKFESFVDEIKSKEKEIKEKKEFLKQISNDFKATEIKYEKALAIHQSIENELNKLEKKLKNSIGKSIEVSKAPPDFLSPFLEEFFELKPLTDVESINEDEKFIIKQNEKSNASLYLKGRYVDYFPPFKITKTLKESIKEWYKERKNYISEDGYVLNYNGVLYKAKGGRIIELKNKIKEITPSLETLEHELSRIKESYHQKKNEIAFLENELKSLKLKQEKTDYEKEKAINKKNILSERAENIKKRIKIIEMEISQAEEEKKYILKILIEKEKELENSRKKMNKTKNEKEDLNSLILRFDKELKSLYEKENAIADKISSLKTRESVISAEVSSSMDAEKREEKRIKELERKLQELSNEILILKKRIKEDEEKIKELNSLKKEKEKEIEKIKNEEEELKAKIESINKSIKSKRRKLSKLLNEENRLNIEKAELKRDISNIEKNLWNDLTLTIEEIIEDDFAEKHEYIEKEVIKLSEKLNSIGEVNFDAETEFERYSKKFQYLEEQRKDILDSILSTKKALNKIDKESEEKFSKTLKIVNENFNEIFRILFNGGKAEIKLLNEEDLLNSGVELLLKLPSTRIKNLNLLSGGQKALGSLAFLFSLFRYKPAPLCIMDEVDAPLDEENIKKFSELLKHFKSDTQFIIVTHNPKTFEIADTSYGITMDEAGVSSVYSVKINE